MSLPDDEHPPASPSRPRDPLLDDPVFAEIVSPPSPVVGEPVEGTIADLPVAEVVQPSAATPESLPKAVPVRAAWPKAPGSPTPALPTAATQTEPPKPQWFAACGVIGCFGVAGIAAVAILAWIALSILSQIGKFAERKTDNSVPTVGVPRIRPGPVEPTKLAGDVTIPLTGMVDAVGLGGGGRFLLLRFPRERQLLVFDANAAEIVERLDLGDPNALFAAGARKVFIYRPQSRRLIQFDLFTGQLESEVLLPPDALVDALAIGPDSEGPLYVIRTEPGKRALVQAFDTATLSNPKTYPFPAWKGRPDRVVHAQASSDGTLLTVASAEGAVAIRFDPGERPQLIPLAGKSSARPELARPSPDGQFIYTSLGVFDSRGKHVVGTKFFTFPSAHGSGLYLSLDVENGKVGGAANLHDAGSTRTLPLVTLGKAEITGDLPANTIREKAILPDDRVQFWPTAGLLVILPASNQELKLYKVDVEAELREASRDFLAFATDPPRTVRPGIDWQYAPRLWSKSKVDPQIKLPEGPEGMNIKKGHLFWRPKAGFNAPVDVEISATADDLKAVQKFRIWPADSR
jgi:hypothetical protein